MLGSFKRLTVFLLWTVLFTPGFALSGSVFPTQCETVHVPGGTFKLWDEPKEVSDAAFTDQIGRKFKISDFKGKPILVHFWGTWCPPCILEMPALSRLAEAERFSDLLILPLSRDSGGTSQVLAFYEEKAITGLPVVTDRYGKLAYGLAVNKVPETIYVDREGREIGRLTGMFEWDDENVRAHLADCLALE